MFYFSISIMGLTFEWFEEQGYRINIKRLKTDQPIYVGKYGKSISVYHPKLSYEYDSYINENGVKTFEITKEYTEEEYTKHWDDNDGNMTLVDHDGTPIMKLRPLVKLCNSFEHGTEEFNHHRDVIKSVIMQDDVIKVLSWKLSFIGSRYEATRDWIYHKYIHYRCSLKWNLRSLFIQYSLFHFLFGLMQNVKSIDDIERLKGIMWIKERQEHEKTKKDYVIHTNGNQLAVTIYSKDGIGYNFLEGHYFNQPKDYKPEYEIHKYGKEGWRCGTEVYGKSHEKYEDMKQIVNELFTQEMVREANYFYNIYKFLGLIK